MGVYPRELAVLILYWGSLIRGSFFIGGAYVYARDLWPPSNFGRGTFRGTNVKNVKILEYLVYTLYTCSVDVRHTETITCSTWNTILKAMTNEKKLTQKLEIGMQSYKLFLDEKADTFRRQANELFTTKSQKEFDALVRFEELDALIESFRWEIWHQLSETKERANKLEEAREGINTKSE